MSREQFAAMMPYITDNLAAMIAKRQELTELDAISKLYASKLYAMFECEETKLWQYSSEMLYSLFVQEQQTGSIDFPDV